MKYAPGLLLIPDVFNHFDKGLRKNFWNLITFAKLIGHFSIKPLPQVQTELVTKFCRNVLVPLAIIVDL
jgi:hypothetical protein